MLSLRILILGHSGFRLRGLRVYTKRHRVAMPTTAVKLGGSWQVICTADPGE